MSTPLDPQSMITTAYFAILALLGLYGLHRLQLITRFRWGAGPVAPRSGDATDLPHVTVQLPLYNERTVAERLIDAVCALEYPAERLEIQVLDDSNDETCALVDEVAQRQRARGVEIEVVRRAERTGFKAGALDYGLKTARGELICVFDADFIPRPDFLLRLVQAFDDPAVGMTQARWGHANRESSLLTRAQATLLDGHFVIEHKTRFDRELFFNFNGTAGIWRRVAIADAGGWQHDTLTEDLDLSYRAQLAGWKFVYAHDVIAPAEVPPDIAAFKSQQHRWAKGSVQVLRKLGPEIVTARAPWRVKLEALTHLTSNIGYPSVLALALLLPAMVSYDQERFSWLHAFGFIACTLTVIVFYWRSQVASSRSFWQRLADAMSALALGIGMSVSQTRAVCEGFFGSTGTFVRTPKVGETNGSKLYRARLSGLPGIELLLSAWFLVGCIQAVQSRYWGSLPFLGLFLWGFTWVGWLSLRDALAQRAARPSQV